MDFEYSGGQLKVQDVGEGSVKIRCAFILFYLITIITKGLRVALICSNYYIYSWQLFFRLYEGRIAQGSLRGTPVVFKVIFL
jgi:hypothetical protein